MEECVQHSHLRHPNIVQLLGVCFISDKLVPTLVLEFLHSSLTSYLEHHPDLPPPFKHRILLDVSVGLRFLHERSPPILHRDLTGNNVLLTEDLRAKISDLGMARIIPPDNHSLTMAPGNMDFMPPESRNSSPQYSEKLDMFSFGVLIMQVVLQYWPSPIKEAAFIDPENGIIARTEVERREDFFSKMEPLDLLTQISKKCLHNDPQMRPTAETVYEKLKPLVDDFSHFHTSLLELYQKFEKMKSEIDQIKQSIAQIDNYSILKMKELEKQLQSVLDSAQGDTSRQASNDDLQPHRLVFGLQPVSSSEAEQVSSKDKLLKVYSLPLDCSHTKISRSSKCSHPVALTICRSFSHTFSGTYVKTVVTGLKRSLGLAVRNGHLYVVDRDGWKGVHIFNIETGEARSIVDSNKKIGYAHVEKCWGPRGIVLDSDGNIVISDFGNHRVARFTPEGKFLKTSGAPYASGKEPGQFNSPLGLCFTKEGKLIVCDMHNNRVQVLRSDLTCKHVFGKTGCGDCDFSEPRDAAVDSRGNIYIVDSKNYCVKVFDYEFTFVKKFGKEGTEGDGFQCASSLCIDARDFVYVSDRTLNCVKIFDPSGVFKMSFEGLFQESFGIAMDESGHLFVSDSYNGKVHMYQ